MTSLRLDGVGFVYPDGTRALDGIDFAIGLGESVGIIGQNGSGKSTLVRHLNGLLRPTEGRVLHDDADIADRRVAALAARVGIVFQDPDRQIFAGKVRDEVAFGPKLLRRSAADTRRTVEAALAAVGLDGVADQNPYDLGYSRRKLLALASVLAMETPVLVLDEPTTGQDARGVGRVRELVADVVAAGRTVIAISHDMRFVAETFGRVVVMGVGRVLLDGTPAEVFGTSAWPTLASTFLEPPYAARVGARLGLGSTPTEAGVVAALRTRPAGRSTGRHVASTRNPKESRQSRLVPHDRRADPHRPRPARTDEVRHELRSEYAAWLASPYPNTADDLDDYAEFIVYVSGYVMQAIAGREIAPSDLPSMSPRTREAVARRLAVLPNDERSGLQRDYDRVERLLALLGDYVRAKSPTRTL